MPAYDLAAVDLNPRPAPAYAAALDQLAWDLVLAVSARLGVAVPLREDVPLASFSRLRSLGAQLVAMTDAGVMQAAKTRALLTILSGVDDDALAQIRYVATRAIELYDAELYAEGMRAAVR